jgi:sigma-B regulation protein RsbU (phosphoserine phosphatase)
MPEELPALPSVEQLFDELPCGVLVTSIRGTILKVNKTLCTWLGMEPVELIQCRKLSDLFTTGGRIFHQTHWVPTLQMQASLAEVKFEVVHKDGRRLPMLLNAIRKVSAGVGYDEITLTMAEERHKYEKELLLARNRADDLARQERGAQLVLEAAQSRLLQAVRVGAMFLWDVNPGTGKRTFDPDVAKLLGYPAPRPIDEDMFVAAIRPEDVESEAYAFQKALREPSHVHSWTHHLEGVDGVRRVISVSGQAFLEIDGHLSQFVGVLSDVTEVARQRAVAEDRALFAEQMIGIVSHDLRNPLSAILTGATVIGLGDDLPEPKKKALARVVSSTQRARRLIDELLDFTLARVGRGLTVSRQSVDLHQLTAKIVDELSSAFPGRRLKHVTVGTGASAADADRISQLVGNLVGNAVAYGAEDADITVTSWLLGSTATITVHNEGNAIPAEMQASIFEPMVRGAPENSAARSVGLGLFIVKAVATAHDGEVKIRSAPETGTTFEFTFPAVPKGSVNAEAPK